MDSKKEYEVVTVKTEPFQDQIADCKGLIRTVKHFQTPNYVENYLQGCFHVLDILEPVWLIINKKLYLINLNLI
jgi:hypothetical protein